jgi:hypothetical protein
MLHCDLITGRASFEARKVYVDVYCLGGHADVLGDVFSVLSNFSGVRAGSSSS